VQTQVDGKEPTRPSQTGNTGKYLTTDGSAKSWGTVSQYALPTQTGNAGKFLTTNGTAESWGTVTTPIKWYLRKSYSDQPVYAFASNGTNIYVSGHNNGQIWSSTDSGVTWTQRTSNFGTNAVYSIAFGNGIFVAVGDAGTITTSTDGITWTARTANMGTNAMYKVVYANSLFVAVGQGGGTTNTGGITYSTDGITWTRKSQSITTGASYNTVVWDGTHWIVGGTVSTNNYIYATTPGGTWTAAVEAGGSTVRHIFWDGTRHIWLTNDWYYNTGSHLSSGISFRGNMMLSSWTSDRKLYYYNGYIYTHNITFSRFNTTLSTAAGGYSGPTDFENLSLSPTPFAGEGATLQSVASGIWVGADNKYMVGDNYGFIWTSF
jgi:photosystem II stability/assembly factor-like uncharacterized protein